ncbi:hypothetical protein EMMF5_004704 [Cystobasidiomycetes sp. EMM_F5]
MPQADQSGSQALPNGIPPATNGISVSQPTTPNLPPEAIELASRLFDMARTGNMDGLTQYLNAGIPANIRNGGGDTFIMLAAYHNHPKLVSELIKRGGDVNILNDRGQSPLAGAIFKGYDEVVEVLVKEGNADIRAGKPTAVECAAMFKRWEAARLMGAEEEARQLGPLLNLVGSHESE